MARNAGKPHSKAGGNRIPKAGQFISRDQVTQIAVYAEKDLYRKVQGEAQERRRKLGPTCLEILREYFERKNAPVQATR